MKQFRCRQRPRCQLPAMILDIWIFVFFILTVQSWYWPQGYVGHLGTARQDSCVPSKTSEALSDLSYFCPSSGPGHYTHIHTYRRSSSYTFSMITPAIGLFQEQKGCPQLSHNCHSTFIRRACGKDVFISPNNLIRYFISTVSHSLDLAWVYRGWVICCFSLE